MRRFILALLLTLAGPLSAQSYQDAFDLRFGTARVARLILAVNDTGDSYALAARAESTGLVAIFRALRFDVAATGDRTGDRLTSLSYREDVDTGRRASTVSMRWQGGAPVIDARMPDGPAEAWDIEPAAQTGTIDPLSALYSVTRPRAETALCGFTHADFDGRRRSEVTLGRLREDGEFRLCNGIYRRVAGFSPDEMAERVEFPFNARFAQGADGLWSLQSVELQSLFGAMRITRAGS